MKQKVILPWPRFLLTLAISFALLSPQLLAQIELAKPTALTFFSKHQKEICQLQDSYGVDSREVLAVVYPELLRYNFFRDALETKALELIYVNFGSREADFSIGHFQMKPSFIERMEQIIRKHPRELAHLKNISEYPSVDEKEQRRIRFARMQDVRWQLVYAFGYYSIAQACFPNARFSSLSEKVKFFSAAYNLGFSSTEQEIAQWIPQKAFPFGRRHIGPQVSYASLSAEFYENDSVRFDCGTAADKTVTPSCVAVLGFLQ